MRKLGRRLGEDERFTKIRLLNLVPEEPPGSRFNELVRAAKAISISKPTLWRHLMRFEKLGLVIHEGRFYRRNPIPDEKGEFTIRVELNGADGSVLKQHAWNLDIKTLRQLGGLDYWDPKQSPRDERGDMLDPDKLFGEWQNTIMLALSGYQQLLISVLHSRDLASAREIANITMNSQVRWPLMRLARRVWDAKDKIRLESFDGKQMKFYMKARVGKHSTQPATQKSL